MPSPSLDALVPALLPPRESLASIEKLFGEASYREYFRIRTASGATYVLMKIPPGKMSVSEEITNFEGTKDELPFVNVLRWLQASDIPSPRLLARDMENGLFLLQDLGDKTLEKLLPDCNDGMRLFFYRQAVDLLLAFQKAGIEKRDPACYAFRRSFDLRLLNWEFDHFLDYGIEDRFGIKIPEAEKKRIQEAGYALIRPIADIPFGLTHRDFQSRNLMMYGYQFHLIDFQDALLGPPQYDLVALLRDSYVVLPFATWKGLLDYYLAARDKSSLPKLEAGAFFTGFHRITIQRKLKDAGRFQFIKTVKGNDKFLPHVPASLEYVRQAFALLPEAKPLQDMLAAYVPELKA